MAVLPDFPPMDDAAPAPRPFQPRGAFGPVLVSWLCPGAGHFVIGRPWPGIFVAVSIWTLFGAGMALSGFENVSWERHPWLFGLQVLAGIPAGAGALLTKGAIARSDLFTHHTVGDLYTCVAGLLNLVAIADVHARCTEGDPERRLARKLAEDRALAGDGDDVAYRPEDLVAGGAPAAPDEGPPPVPAGGGADV